MHSATVSSSSSSRLVLLLLVSLVFQPSPTALLAAPGYVVIDAADPDYLVNDGVKHHVSTICRTGQNTQFPGENVKDRYTGGHLPGNADTETNSASFQKIQPCKKPIGQGEFDWKVSDVCRNDADGKQLTLKQSGQPVEGYVPKDHPDWQQLEACKAAPAAAKAVPAAQAVPAAKDNGGYVAKELGDGKPFILMEGSNIGLEACKATCDLGGKTCVDIMKYPQDKCQERVKCCKLVCMWAWQVKEVDPAMK